VVTDSLVVINKIGDMIPALDEITPQVLIEAKIIETSLTTEEKLGIRLDHDHPGSGLLKAHDLSVLQPGLVTDMYADSGQLRVFPTRLRR